MRALSRYGRAAAILLVVPLPLGAASQAESAPEGAPAVTRTVQASNYPADGSTTVALAATSLEPGATGRAQVRVQDGRTLIEAEFAGLAGPEKFGAEYRTYVLWAIGLNGRAVNLGQVNFLDRRPRLTVTTGLQTFGLILTAEPYFAVSEPSDTVVLEGAALADAARGINEVQVSAPLRPRGFYAAPNPDAAAADPSVPAELQEARNAMRIARAQQAERYAPDAWARADAALARAEEALETGQSRLLFTAAREATQAFEDARWQALERREAERRDEQRRAAEQREAQARAEQEAARQRLEAQVAEARTAQEHAEAELLRQMTILRQREDAERAQRAQQAEEMARRERQLLRERLLLQFSQSMNAADTPRGLVVTLGGDVTFPPGSDELRPEGRDALSRIAGLVLPYPSLRLTVEAHTDSSGGDEYNQILSEQRAVAVRRYLVENGLPPEAISVRGFGESQPVADNATAAGRQQNRRIEIVVFGEAIGMEQ